MLACEQRALSDDVFLVSYICLSDSSVLSLLSLESQSVEPSLLSRPLMAADDSMVTMENFFWW